MTEVRLDGCVKVALGNRVMTIRERPESVESPGTYVTK